MAPPKRRYMDPSTRDYIMTRGQRQADETHSSEVLFHIFLQRGTAGAYPDFGSRFHEIQKMIPGVTKEAELMTEEALKPLTDDGRILDLDPEASLTTVPYKLKLDVSWRDSLSRKNEKKLRIKL